MNNSDFNDFRNWQNGDEGDDANNPNNNPNGFFFYGNMSPEFRKMWNDINSGQDFTENMKEYLNMDDIMKEWSRNNNPKPKNPMNNRRPMKHRPQPQKNMTTFSRDDYEKLIEIRGYLNITEQRAHVKALDKLLSQIVIVPIDPKDKQ
jgi:hypothetical protein